MFEVHFTYWMPTYYVETCLALFETYLKLCLKLFGTILFVHILDGKRLFWKCFNILDGNICPCGPEGRGIIAQSRFVSVSVYLLFEIHENPIDAEPLVGNNK